MKAIFLVIDKLTLDTHINTHTNTHLHTHKHKLKTSFIFFEKEKTI